MSKLLNMVEVFYSNFWFPVNLKGSKVYKSMEANEFTTPSGSNNVPYSFSINLRYLRNQKNNFPV